MITVNVRHMQIFIPMKSSQMDVKKINTAAKLLKTNMVALSVKINLSITLLVTITWSALVATAISNTVETFVTDVSQATTLIKRIHTRLN